LPSGETSVVISENPSGPVTLVGPKLYREAIRHKPTTVRIPNLNINLNTNSRVRSL